MSDRGGASALTGGCQCGALRYTCDQAPDNVHVCHRRMCQKAVSGAFAVICPVQKSALRLTRGAFSWFHSSALARRGFCGACGTPMVFDYPAFDDIGVLVGTFDQPSEMPPVVQYGIESRVSWFEHLRDLPGDQPTYAQEPQGYLPRIAASNRQHPDYDTLVWPSASESSNEAASSIEAGISSLPIAGARLPGRT